MSSLVTWLELSRLWLLGRILIPLPRRRRACQARGDHRPRLVDLGRRKVCLGCGT